MTIGGWIACVLIWVMIAVVVIFICHTAESGWTVLVSILVGGALCFAIFSGVKWFYMNTATGQRAKINERSELTGGLDRTITVYTADGNIIAQYEGQIDIQANDGGFVLFDFDGKRYIYYNCFVETIADLTNE